MNELQKRRRDRQAREAPRLAGRQADRAARPRLQARHRRHARGLEPGARRAPPGRGGRGRSPTTRSPRNAPRALLPGVEIARLAPSRRSTAPTRRCSSPSGPSSPSSTGPRPRSGWRTRSSSTAATSSTPTRCAPPGFAYEGIGRPPRGAGAGRDGRLMQALILVGGQGTRLRPLTDAIPKPVLPLVGRPLIAYMIDWLAAPRGRRRRGLAAASSPTGCARRSTGSPGRGSASSTSPSRRGTAGAIRFAADQLGDRFLVLNGDVLCDLDLTRAGRPARGRPGARATIALYPVEDPTAYGLVRRERGRRGHRVPREARPRRDRHRRDQRRRLRPRALGARPDPARRRRLDRARGLPAPGRRGPVRSPPGGLLDGHRDARPLPAGELGHPRGPRRDRGRASASATTGLLVARRRRGRPRRQRRGPGAGRGAGRPSAPAPRSARAPSSAGLLDRRGRRGHRLGPALAAAPSGPAPPSTARSSSPEAEVVPEAELERRRASARGRRVG